MCLVYDMYLNLFSSAIMIDLRKDKGMVHANQAIVLYLDSGFH